MSLCGRNAIQIRPGGREAVLDLKALAERLRPGERRRAHALPAAVPAGGRRRDRPDRVRGRPGDHPRHHGPRPCPVTVCTVGRDLATCKIRAYGDHLRFSRQSCNNPHSPLGLVGIYVVTQVLQQAEQLRQASGARSILAVDRQHPAGVVPADDAGGRAVEVYAKAEWYNPGGSVKDRAGAGDGARRRTPGAADPRQDPGGRDQRQHRHRLRDDLRRARLPAEARPAAERQPGAQAEPARLRGRADPDRSDRGDRWRPAVREATGRRGARTSTSTPTSTTTKPTGGPLRHDRDGNLAADATGG